MAKILYGATKFFPFASVSEAWKGAFWKVVSCACFAGINGIVRYWSGGIAHSHETLPINVMILFQNIFGALFLLPWLLKSGLPNLQIQHLSLHLLRVLTAVLGVYLWYLSLQTMPIAEGVALTFTGPIFTLLGASIFLKEKLTGQKMIAISLSVIGAFIIARPDLPFYDGYSLGLAALLPLSSALSLALSKLLTRKLTNLGEAPLSLATYLLLLMIPASLIPVSAEWNMPHLIHWPWLITLGALAAAAHFSFSKAYQLAEVTFLTPFGFTKFFLSTLIGFLAFAEFPNYWSLWSGIFIIFISIFLIAYKIPLYSWANRFKSS